MSATPHVRLRLPDGAEVTLTPGDIIGRMPRAALRVEDPRVSEAHCLVSLRGAELEMLALRGRISLDGRPVSAVRLTPGTRFVLAGFLALTVVDAALPERVFALELSEPVSGRGSGPLALQGVMALHVEAPPRLVPRFDPAAPLVAWANESGVFFRVRDESGDRHLRAGETLEVSGLRARVVLAPLSAVAAASTHEQGRFDMALTLTIHYDTVHVRPSAGPAVVFDGQAARLLSEVAQLATPASWQTLATLLWEDEDDEHVLRYRWDQATSRVRKKLRAGGIRGDLIRSTGAGLVELFLGPEDRVEDLS